MYTKAMPLPFLPPPAALTVQKENHGVQRMLEKRQLDTSGRKVLK